MPEVCIFYYIAERVKSPFLPDEFFFLFLLFTVKIPQILTDLKLIVVLSDDMRWRASDREREKSLVKKLNGEDGEWIESFTHLSPTSTLVPHRSAFSLQESHFAIQKELYTRVWIIHQNQSVFQSSHQASYRSTCKERERSELVWRQSQKSKSWSIFFRLSNQQGFLNSQGYLIKDGWHSSVRGSAVGVGSATRRPALAIEKPLNRAFYSYE